MKSPSVRLRQLHRCIRSASALAALIVASLGAAGSVAARPVAQAEKPSKEEAVVENDYLIWQDAIESAMHQFSTRFAGKRSQGRHLTVIRLKGPEPVPSRSVQLSDGRMEIRFVPGARFTLEEGAEVASRVSSEMNVACPEIGGARYDGVRDSFIFELDPEQGPSCKYPEMIEGVPLRTYVVGKLELLSIRGGGVIQGEDTCPAGSEIVFERRADAFATFNPLVDGSNPSRPTMFRSPAATP